MLLSHKRRRHKSNRPKYDSCSSFNLQITSAHVTTYGERAVDVFYVKDLFGLKIVNQDKLKQVSEEVEKSIRDFDARFEPAKAAAE